HRMAIDQHGGAEIAVQAREQTPQRPVIGLVQALDAGKRVVNRDALVVDFLRVADDARHGAKPAGDPHRARVGEGGQAAIEHARIEFVGLAIHVHEAARKMRPHQREALAHHARNQRVDETVLGAAQRGDIEARNGEELARIDRPAMWRVEQNRPAIGGRLHDLEGRVELVADFTHGGRWSLGPAAGAMGFGGWARRAQPFILSIVHRRMDKAKPCFRFTRYLPAISLNRRARGRPSGNGWTGYCGVCRKSSWLKTTRICGAFWSRRWRTPDST